MKAGKRGRTGTVRGIPEKEAGRYLLALFRYIRDSLGGAFQRRDARDFLMSEFGLPQSKADGVVFALLRINGMAEPAGRFGVHRLVGGEELVRHRLWRFRVGNLNYTDAQELVFALGNHGNLSPSMAALKRRAEKTLNNAEK